MLPNSDSVAHNGAQDVNTLSVFAVAPPLGDDLVYVLNYKFLFIARPLHLLFSHAPKILSP